MFYNISKDLHKNNNLADVPRTNAKSGDKFPLRLTKHLWEMDIVAGCPALGLCCAVLGTINL